MSAEASNTCIFSPINKACVLLCHNTIVVSHSLAHRRCVKDFPPETRCGCLFLLGAHGVPFGSTLLLVILHWYRVFWCWILVYLRIRWSPPPVSYTCGCLVLFIAKFFYSHQLGSAGAEPPYIVWPACYKAKRLLLLYLFSINTTASPLRHVTWLSSEPAGPQMREPKISRSTWDFHCTSGRSWLQISTIGSAQKLNIWVVTPITWQNNSSSIYGAKPVSVVACWRLCDTCKTMECEVKENWSAPCWMMPWIFSPRPVLLLHPTN